MIIKVSSWIPKPAGIKNATDRTIAVTDSIKITSINFASIPIIIKKIYISNAPDTHPNIRKISDLKSFFFL